MAPRRRVLELAFRRAGETLRRRLRHEGHAGLASGSGWRPGSGHGDGDRTSTDTSSTTSGAFSDLLLLSEVDFYHRRQSNGSSRSFASSHHRGFAASAKDEETATTDQRPKREERSSLPAAEEITPSSSSSFSPPSAPPPSSSASSSSPLSGHWLSRVLPRGLWPYAELARLDKPAGTWLLAWPCAWSIVLATASSSSPAPPLAAAAADAAAAAAADAAADAAAGATSDLLLPLSPAVASAAHLLALFGVGSLLLRGAGCTVNDLWDREFDRKVERTASRPLARGAVSPASATAFLAAQLAAGAAVLAQLNPSSVVVGVAALPLVALYPLAKRVTDWPQAVLGLTFNWGALLGWTAVKGGSESVLEIATTTSEGGGEGSFFFALEPVFEALSSSAAALPSLLTSPSSSSLPAPWLLLYSAGICWTLCYDTIYAYQDSRDDAKAGVRSSALALKSRGLEKAGVAAFGAAAVALLAAAGHSGGIGCAAFYGSMVCGPGMHMAWQLSTLDPADAGNCARRFRSNAVFGGLVAAAIAVGAAGSAS